MEKAYKNLPMSIVKTVLELTEGFAPEGVSKDEWKREVLGGWQRTPKTFRFCDMTLNPTDVRLEIERHNEAVGPLQWGAVRGNGARGPCMHRFLATPPITKKLEGYMVHLARYTKARFTRRNEFPGLQGHLKILEVNNQGTAFKHNYGKKEFWCRKADISYMHLIVEYCDLQDTSD